MFIHKEEIQVLSDKSYKKIYTYIIIRKKSVTLGLHHPS